MEPKANIPIRVLILEDNDDDKELVLLQLKKGGYNPEYDCIETREELVDALDKHSWDIILCDYSMPKFDGLSALQIVIESGADIPFVLISGTVGEDVAVEAMKAGAQDYMLKDNLIRLVPVVKRELAEAIIRKEKKQAEKNLKDTFDVSPSIIAKANIDNGYFIVVNQAVTRILGYSIEEFISKPMIDYIHTDDQSKTTDEGNKQLDGNEVNFFENRYLCKDGSYKWIAWYGTKADENGIVTVIGSDITERKQAELELIKTKENVEESEAKYSRMVENMNSGVAIYKAINNGKDFKIIDFNKAAERITNTTANDVLGNSLLNKFPNMDKSPLFLGLKSVFKSGKDIHIPPFFYKDKQREGWRENYIYKLPSGEIVAIFDDVTERKNAEINLQNQYHELSLAKDRAEESEQRYRALYTHNPLMIFTIDEEGTILSVNETGVAQLEYSREELLGNSVLLLFHDNDKQKVIQLKEECLLNPDEILTWELRKISKNGKLIYVNENARVIQANDGSKFILVMCEDITERKLAEEALKESTLFNLQIINSAQEGIVVYDQDMKCITWNPYMENMTGIPASEVKGMSAIDIFPFLKESGVVDNIKKALKGVINSAIDFPYSISSSGKRGWASDTVGPLRNSMGEIIGAISTVQDITKRKEEEQKLTRALEKATESDRLKSAFLANMSHEIRTPMNGILGFSNLLKQPKLTGEQQQHYISIIEKSGARMLNIINEIIDISKIEAGLMKLDIRELNIDKQIEDVYTFFKPEAEAKKIHLFVNNLLPDKEAVLLSDPEKLNAVLFNLVKNAIKYTDSGSIELACYKKGNSIEYYVKDTGIGIQKDRMNAIFERFIQADIIDVQARQGAGLGLSISKAYIEMLDGQMWVESEPGLGSTFYFSLPFTGYEKQEIEPEKNRTSLIQENPVKKLKFLIAEDDEISEMLLSAAISKMGDEILKARTGKETIDICRSNPDIDIILMDIQMPDLNGYEATRQIREFNKTVIIIAQTAFGLSGDREKSINAGCNDYISKPIDREELVTLIRKYFY